VTGRAHSPASVNGQKSERSEWLRYGLANEHCALYIYCAQHRCPYLWCTDSLDLLCNIVSQLKPQLQDTIVKTRSSWTHFGTAAIAGLQILRLVRTVAPRVFGRLQLLTQCGAGGRGAHDKPRARDGAPGQSVRWTGTESGSAVVAQLCHGAEVGLMCASVMEVMSSA
jgi:hypothetical protein